MFAKPALTSTLHRKSLIAHILYALPALGGSISTEHNHQVNAFLDELNPMDT